MWSTARTVSPGDTVIIWLTRDQLQPLTITPGKDFNTKFGNFKQLDFVGVPYGSKVPCKSGRGFVHILRPTPELWTLALPHRTQILYLADIAFITAHLGIRPGSRVIEAGTGSASFSHSITRTIGSRGRLYSYEFHEARYLKAKEEFERHRMDDVVTLQHRNVCKDGFTVEDEVDAVFLDLPAPWEAVEHAKKALRKDRVTRICCFSPCMEQVLRTVNALNEAGFTEITMHETLLRPIEVFQTPPLPSVDGLSAKLKRAEVRREEKRQRQIAANKAQAAALAAAAAGEAGVKRKLGEEDDDEEDIHAKRARTEADGSSSATIPSSSTTASTSTTVSLPSSTSSTSTSTTLPSSSSLPTSLPLPQPTPTPTLTKEKINVSKALQEVRGHTSYLTFACLAPVPGWVSSVPSAAAAAATDGVVDGADGAVTTDGADETVVDGGGEGEGEVASAS